LVDRQHTGAPNEPAYDQEAANCKQSSTHKVCQLGSLENQLHGATVSDLRDWS
jgi:hypothetical protein